MNRESDGWKYIENAKSSAKWPLQTIHWFKGFRAATDNECKRVFYREDIYITNEAGKQEIKHKKKEPTFELFLKSAMAYYEKRNKEIPSWIQEAYDYSPFISPLTLAHEETLNLFLLWNFSGNNEDYFKDMVLKGDESRVAEFYTKIHHGNPTEKLLVLVAAEVEKLKWEFQDVATLNNLVIPASAKTRD